jgi:hypothetical protein
MLAKQPLYCLSHTTSPFCSGYFGNESLKLFSLGWLQTTILTISASQVARIIGVGYWCPADLNYS